ncbi:MAG: DNA topoisomerase IB [Acidimicrobiia bacterium]
MSPTAVPSLHHFEPDDLLLRRVRRGRGFSYHDQRDARVDDPDTLARIRALAIPPAWVDVRVSDRADSHLQAVGRDARGRMQYRYHQDWRAFRDRVKFDRLTVFGETLPAVRTRIARDLTLKGMPRDKVIATIVALLQTTLIRVGNEEYARTNGAYGLTTFRNRHAKISGSEIEFVFVGKSGLRHDVHVRDARVARVLRRCQEIPGQRLFQYVDPDDGVVPVYSNDVNDYLRDASGVDVTAKDFRTWVATVTAAAALGPLDPPESETEAKKVINDVVREVAFELGNTPAVSRASYIHPKVLTDFASGALRDEWSTAAPRRSGLTLEERHTMLVLDPSRRRRARRPRAAAA